MNARLPLPLQLTQPTEMASSLEDVLKESYLVASMKYNPETQVRETAEGVPMLYNGGSHCDNDTQSWDYGIVIDVKLDIQVDDLF